jgi:hypothetical protein
VNCELLTFVLYPLSINLLPEIGFNMPNKLTKFLVVCFCLVPSLSFARTEFTPAISVSELYDDNIDLTQTNKISDWITTISPSLNLTFASEKNNFQLRYAPSIVRYKKTDNNNTIGQSGTLTLGEELTDRLRVDLNDTLLRSEDPIEQTEGVFGARRTRNPYLRNNGGASFTYLFGPEDTFKLGYNHSFLKNEDVNLNDNTYATPFMGLTYWFNVSNGIELNYQYNIADFSRDDNIVPSDAYTGNAVGLKYSYRFSQHTTATLGYNLNTRLFEGATENYDIHEGKIGLTHSFKNDTSLSLSGGYFQLKNEHSPDDNGFSYNASFTKNFNRGNFTIGGNGGWREGYQEAVRTGLIKYWGMNSQFSYQILERLENHASIFYIQNKEEATERKYKTYGGSYGWRWSFLRWFSLSVDYTRSDRRDDIDAFSYVDNRVMMSLTANRLFR